MPCPDPRGWGLEGANSSHFSAGRLHCQYRDAYIRLGAGEVRKRVYFVGGLRKFLSVAKVQRPSACCQGSHATVAPFVLARILSRVMTDYLEKSLARNTTGRLA